MDKTRPVRFYDENFRLLKEVQDAVIIYNEKWHTYSQFEIHLPKMAPYIEIDNRVIFDRDERKNGIIKYIHTDNDGGVTLKGFSLLWIFSDRLTIPEEGKDYVSYDAQAEDIMIDLVKKNAVECTDKKRNFPNFATDRSRGRGKKLAYQTTYGNLMEELESLSKVSLLGIGVRMDIQNRQYVFEVLEGINRTQGQKERPPVIFRRGYENIRSTEYTLDDSATKNCAYTAGQGEGSARAVYIVNDDFSGFGRKELFVDARDIEDASGLPDRGISKLAEFVCRESFEAEVAVNWYKTRWDLGDMVTVIDDETGITLNHYISEVEEIMDENGYEVIPTFGVPQKSISSLSGSGAGAAGGRQTIQIATENDAGTVKGGENIGIRQDGTLYSKPKYGECSTAAGTATKIVACEGFSLIIGAEIVVKFTVTNTASNPMLNVNKTGAKAIYYRGAVISAGHLAAKRTYTFCYNGNQYELVGDVDTDTVYTHPTTAGNKHIPAGGASGQILGWSSSGTAKWTNPDAAGTQVITQASQPPGHTAGRVWVKTY